MEKNTLKIVGGLAALAFLFSNRSAIASTVIDYTTPRGLRNNNPGNIVKSSLKLKNEIPGNDATYRTFKTMADGYTALFELLAIYIANGYNTIRKMFAHYESGSPKSDIDNYVNYVSSTTGINPDAVLSMSQTANILAIAKAISQKENGKIAVDSDVNQGWQKYWDSW
jgi:hypothetical protein